MTFIARAMLRMLRPQGHPIERPVGRPFGHPFGHPFGPPTGRAFARRLGLVAGLLLASASLQAEAPWPAAQRTRPDAAIEARVEALLARLTLAQKVGQMTQPDIRFVTPAEVRQYAIGSVLNGGGGRPYGRQRAVAADWLQLAREMDQAALEATGIPMIWGTDAVHGHNNVFGATLFPHNIGLGAAADPDLVRDIGRSTARAVRATGIAWTFAPTLAVVQDPRWGRTYEGYGADPALVARLGAAMVEGLQEGLGQGRGVVATAKHFIGDGGTRHGRDQGETWMTEAQLRRIHGAGYYAALRANVLTVMASFNSWAEPGAKPQKLHGHEKLLTQRLKHDMGFDGLVVSDWDGIGQVPGCKADQCAQAIRAGIDLVMVPQKWRSFMANTVDQVERGEIPQARIDDAVRRILRVKLRAGLFDRPPGQDPDAGHDTALQDRALARRAVARTQVLLKNEAGLLPLPRHSRLLVVGKSADNLGYQAGGWSLTWQGTAVTNADFPQGQTLLAALREQLGVEKVQFRADAASLADVDWSTVDVVVAALGETPYAETAGDIPPSGTLRHSSRYPEDLALLDALQGKGKPVATVFMAGRPLWVNDLLNRSQAFVAAWLPGTEGGGMADVLLAGGPGFSGRLSFPWPAVVCPRPGTKPLFALGYGLASAQASRPQRLDERHPAGGCEATTEVPVFDRIPMPPFGLGVKVGTSIEWVGADLSATQAFPSKGEARVELSTVDLRAQQDAKRVRWLGAAVVLARAPQPTVLSAFPQAALVMDVQVLVPPSGPVWLGMACGDDCGARIDISPWLVQGERGILRTLRVPLACFEAQGLDLNKVWVPFALEATSAELAFTRVKVVAGAARHTEALSCR